MARTYNPQRHHRRSIRRPGHDYARVGKYFVTICAHERACLFGDIASGQLTLNEYGRIVEEEWLRTAIIRAKIILDEYIVMPNHVHGIIVLQESTTPARSAGSVVIAGPRPGSLGAIVGGFKAAACSRINLLRGTPGFPAWQRDFHDHIIRNDDEYRRIVAYIRNNPLRWAEDSLFQTINDDLPAARYDR